MSLDHLGETLCDQLSRDLPLQDRSGFFPGGRNGAYGHPETPVRCTAHYLLASCQAYRYSGNRLFLAAAQRAADYLKRAVLRVEGAVIMRHAPGRDTSNGVLGPAFVIEALHAAGHVLDDGEARDLAIAYFDRHPFDAVRGYWQTLTPSGAMGPPDLTFNHQLYFATTAALLFQKAAEKDRRIGAFIAAWPNTLMIREDGRVGHTIPVPRGRKSMLRDLLLLRRRREMPVAKERDYHLYNCYAFALLSQAGIAVRHGVGTARFDRVMQFANAEEVSRLLSERSWTSPQASGTETRVADYHYFMSVFGNRTLDPSLPGKYLIDTLGPGGRGEIVSPDPVNYRARTYRYWRLVQRDGAEEIVL